MVDGKTLEHIKSISYFTALHWNGTTAPSQSIFPSTLCHAMVIVTEHNTTTTNQGTTLVLASNIQPHAAVNNSRRDSDAYICTHS
jgi:hypothetical protein